eukprot:Rmarinus@m.10662
MAEFNNLLLLTDSYKVAHHQQYPPGTQHVYSYFECRGGSYDNICFFGLQYILKKYLVGQVVTKEKIQEADDLMKTHFVGLPALFNREGWEYILERHGGRLPLRIRAIPEGTVLPPKHVLITVENTDPRCYWLTNFVETLLVQVWYPITVATNSWRMKQIIFDSLRETGDVSGLAFKLHDFGYRGSTSVESAGIGGAAHLVNFHGTDNLAALVVARNYYACPCAGVSIPASEHSTITSWGRESEREAMANMLEVYPTGLVACVSDSYDIFSACDNIWGTQLKEKVLARNGCLVVRPDSGDPPTVVVKILNILGSRFGTYTNAQGYKVLDDHVRVIQGDGIDAEMVQKILSAMKAEKWSSTNITFGSGGGLLQKMDRDTCKCAFKCSEIVTAKRERVRVYKDPVTDSGKRSKGGRLALVHRNGQWTTLEDTEASTPKDVPDDLLLDVFLNGELTREYTFEDIRERSNLPFKP